ncbi:tetratricopeptide repeat protein [Thalassovita aquimarina]|nr:hypothetical protein [Thalassovita aquimarina]
MKRLIILAFAFALVGCENVGFGEFSTFSESPGSNKDTSNVSFYPDDELIVSAKVQFREGNYGKSYTMFKKALDVVPDDPQAWLGFAASADMLRRFDKADYAYRKMQPVIGNRIEFLNNYGYSMLLRGDLKVARKYFLLAYEKDPSNPVTANNLEMLRNSINFPRRARKDLGGI